MKKLLLIATGGTIASKYTSDGLSPQIHAHELLSYVPEASLEAVIDTVQPFSLDSTNIGPKQWLELEALIEKKYEYYDGFVICHGTDTMAYTAAALSYLIRNNRKPVVITGAQKPIDLPDTDARTNLLDSIRFAAHERAHGVNIVFGGKVIAGTRAKKERTRSYNAFSSINYPDIAIIQEKRIIFYIDDKDQSTAPLQFSHQLDDKVFLYKLIPGSSGKVLTMLFDEFDAVIIESFGVGGLPQYEEQPLKAGKAAADQDELAGLSEREMGRSEHVDDAESQDELAGLPGQTVVKKEDVSFRSAIRKYMDAGKMVIMATQVIHEGSDMSIYQVGQAVKDEFRLPEFYDMTLEAATAKTMWALGQTKDPEEFRRLFYTPIGHDLMFCDYSRVN